MTETPLAGCRTSASDSRRNLIPRHSPIHVRKTVVSILMAHWSHRLIKLQPCLSRLGKSKPLFRLGLKRANDMPIVCLGTAAREGSRQSHGSMKVTDRVSHSIPLPYAHVRVVESCIRW